MLEYLKASRQKLVQSEAERKRLMTKVSQSTQEVEHAKAMSRREVERSMEMQQQRTNRDRLEREKLSMEISDLKDTLSLALSDKHTPADMVQDSSADKLASADVVELQEECMELRKLRIELEELRRSKEEMEIGKEEMELAFVTDMQIEMDKNAALLIHLERALKKADIQNEAEIGEELEGQLRAAEQAIQSLELENKDTAGDDCGEHTISYTDRADAVERAEAEALKAFAYFTSSGRVGKVGAEQKTPFPERLPISLEGTQNPRTRPV